MYVHDFIRFLCLFFSIFCDQLLAVFKKYPSLVVEEFSNLLEFVSGTKNITGRENFFTHVVCNVLVKKLCAMQFIVISYNLSFPMLWILCVVGSLFLRFIPILRHFIIILSIVAHFQGKRVWLVLSLVQTKASLLILLLLPHQWKWPNFFKVALQGHIFLPATHYCLVNSSICKA